MRSVPEVIARSVELHRQRPALKVRRQDVFEPISYGELWQAVLECATGLLALGLGPGDHVGFFSDNRPEWITLNLAILAVGAVDVPRGRDTPSEELAYILAHSDSRMVILEDKRMWEAWLSVRQDAPAVAQAILIEPPDGPAPGAVTFEELRAEGRRLRAGGDRRAEELMARIKPENLATIIYTSGTTGHPKGVMLTHANLLHNIRVVPPLFRLNAEDRYLSVLPPWHSFERMMEYIILSVGACLAYSRPVRPIFLKDIALERPTFLVAVPRIWEALYQGILTNLKKAPWAHRWMALGLLAACRAYRRALNRLEGREPVFSPDEEGSRLKAHLVRFLTGGLAHLAEASLLPVLRAVTGGKLRAAVSGGAHLPEPVDEFFDSIGIRILEGYGLTETSPVAFSRSFDRAVMHTVGRPIPEVEVRIVEPETGRVLGPGQRGVVQIRGPNVMAGYYKDEEATRRAVDGEGWLDTGDLGRLTVGGDLQLVGRAKDTIVLSSGENIEPEPIEARLKESPYIAQVCLVGHDEKHLGALIVPNAEALARSLGLEEADLARLSEMKEARSLIRREIQRLVNEADRFRPHEHVTAFALLPREFEPGRELTHTLKMRRSAIQELHASTIERLYRRER